MGGKKAPDAPDYVGAAEQQADASREITTQQTWANRPNQQTPWGSVSWDANRGYDPATGEAITRWDQTLSLTPEQQRSLDSQQALQENRSGLANSLYDRLETEYADPVDWSQFTEYGDNPQAAQVEALQRGLSTEGLTELDPSQRYRQDAEDAIYGQFERRMEPQMENQMAALDTQLRNQGLRPGTEAYDYQMQQLRQSQGDQRTGAQYQATMGAGQEAQRMLGMDASTRAQEFGERGAQGQFANQATGQQYGMASQEFGQNLQTSNYQNQIRQQQMAEEMMRRGWTLNEVNAILTGQQVQNPNMPTFNTASKSETPQYMRAAESGYQADLDAFNAEQAAVQGMMSGIGGMASGFMPGP